MTSKLRPQVKGGLLTLIAAICWGLSGVSGQYLMAQGVHVNALTAIRLLVAGLVLTSLVAIRERESLKKILSDKINLAQLLLFALFGLVLNQYAYLKAIQQTNAGTATVLQYVTPVLILVYTCLRWRRKPTSRELTAIVLASLGTAIIATHGDFTSLAMTPSGLFWGLFSALTYALYILLPMRLIKTYGSLAVMALAMLFGGIIFTLTFQPWHYEAQLTLSNLPAYLGIVVVGTILAYTLFLKGISLVGELKGSLLAAVEPVAAVVFAILIMNEIFYLIDLVGMILILLAVLLISQKSAKD